MSLRLETVDLQWESKNKVAGVVQPVSREGHAIFYSEEAQSLFLIGGKNYEFLTEVFELKIETLQWSQVSF
jgi:hypothetical protein